MGWMLAGILSFYFILKQVHWCQSAALFKHFNELSESPENIANFHEEVLEALDAG